MERQPLISVIVPVWNGAKTLRACVESILSQSVADFELLMVDDGSTDDTWALMEQFAGEDERVQIFRQENGGVSTARNLALKQCRGRYVRFVDADDQLPADSLRALLQCAQSGGADLVLAAYTEVLGTQCTVRDLGRCNDTVDNAELLRRLERLSNSFYYGVLWNKLFVGDIIRGNQVEFRAGLAWGEDFTFVMDYLAHAEKISYLTTPVYDYIRNPNGAVVRQFFRCFLHPFASLHDRWNVYVAYRRLYQRRGAYQQYRSRLWLYLIRFTLRN